MQPYFFPYIGYWQLMNAVDEYVIYDDVNFIKGGWINRNRILMKGEGKYINVQLHGASPNKLINEIELSGDTVFDKKLLRTIEYSYKRAPYCEDVLSLLEFVINRGEKNLAKFLELCISQVCTYLDIKTKIVISSTIKKNNDLRGKDKVQHICKMLGADEYINAIGGRDLYSYDEFKSNGIELKFLMPCYIQYQQFSNKFVSNLSIIDVMMFNSKEQINKMLYNYEVL
jgi:hypothetical protein